MHGEERFLIYRWCQSLGEAASNHSRQDSRSVSGKNKWESSTLRASTSPATTALSLQFFHLPEDSLNSHVHRVEPREVKNSTAHTVLKICAPSNALLPVPSFCALDIRSLRTSPDWGSCQKTFRFEAFEHCGHLFQTEIHSSKAFTPEFSGGLPHVSPHL